ncbi:nuclear import protein Mog1p [Monosporozyma unispora]|nr:multicopy suppressor of ts gsp1 [Kazachstania unispora]
MSNNLTTVQLYGGAIATVIPQGFLDASMLREVPDTQEVYVNSRSKSDDFNDGLGFNESVIIDLLQRVEEEDDKKALDFHLKEIADLNGSTEWELLKYDNKFDQLATPSAAQTCIFLETAYKWGKVSEKEIVISCIGLIRLKDVETDVLITVNIPLDSTKYSDETLNRLTESIKDSTKLPQRISTGYNILLEIVKKFNIKDKSLFA